MTNESIADELIELAAVVRAHGLAGEVVLKSFNPESELLSSLDEIVLRSPDGTLRRFEVISRRGHQELLALRGVTDRDAAEGLRGHVVCVPRSALPPLEEGEYYLVDLVGLRVQTPDGSVLGHVEDILEYPSVEALVIITDGIVREVPNLDRYVPVVDVAGGFVVVEHIDEIEPVPLAALRGKR